MRVLCAPLPSVRFFLCETTLHQFFPINFRSTFSSTSQPLFLGGKLTAVLPCTLFPFLLVAFSLSLQPSYDRVVKGGSANAVKILSTSFSFHFLVKASKSGLTRCPIFQLKKWWSSSRTRDWTMRKGGCKRYGEEEETPCTQRCCRFPL